MATIITENFNYDDRVRNYTKLMKLLVLNTDVKSYKNNIINHIKEFPSSVNDVNDCGYSPLHVICINEENIKNDLRYWSIEYLLKNGANVYQQVGILNLSENDQSEQVLANFNAHCQNDNKFQAGCCGATGPTGASPPQRVMTDMICIDTHARDCENTEQLEKYRPIWQGTTDKYYYANMIYRDNGYVGLKLNMSIIKNSDYIYKTPLYLSLMKGCSANIIKLLLDYGENLKIELFRTKIPYILCLGQYVNSIGFGERITYDTNSEFHKIVVLLIESGNMEIYQSRSLHNILYFIDDINLLTKIPLKYIIKNMSLMKFDTLLNFVDHMNTFNPYVKGMVFWELLERKNIYDQSLRINAFYEYYNKDIDLYNMAVTNFDIQYLEPLTKKRAATNA